MYKLYTCTCAVIGKASSSETTPDVTPSDVVKASNPVSKGAGNALTTFLYISLGKFCCKHSSSFIVFCVHCESFDLSPYDVLEVKGFHSLLSLACQYLRFVCPPITWLVLGCGFHSPTKYMYSIYNIICMCIYTMLCYDIYSLFLHIQSLCGQVMSWVILVTTQQLGIEWTDDGQLYNWWRSSVGKIPPLDKLLKAHLR